MKPRKQIRLLSHVQRDEDEEAEMRPLSLGLIRRLLGYTGAYAAKRNWLLAAVIARSIQLPLLAWVIGKIIGGPVARLDVRGIGLGALGYLALAAVTQLTLRYRSRFALQLGEAVIFDLRSRMFAHLHEMPMRFFHKTSLGRVISRFTTDAEAVRVGVQDVLFVSLVQIGQMLMAAGMMLWYDRVLFLVVLAMAPLVWAVNRHFRRRLSVAYRALQESFSRITANLAESVNGIRVTQGFVREEMNAGLFRELVADHATYSMDAARTAGVFLPLLEFKSQLFVALVLLAGGWRVFHHATEVQNLYQFILMAGMFFGPIQALGNQYNNALTAMAGAERVFRLLDTKPEWTDPPDAVPLPDLRGRVEFRHVGFAYEPGRPVLHDVNFAVEPGQTVALVGHTGSGKSSIVNLIAKFYLPTRGEVCIDGHEIRTLATDSLHRRMGIVLQQNFLFTGTVMDNIRIGKPSASDVEVIAATRNLSCADLIENLPDGFQTQVGEGGAGISLGQRQLICFARAMLADPRILILDEATSSVDTLTEARIQEALTALLRNRTNIVVAHRLSTVRHADLVLALKDGHIVERGTHAELLAAGGVYAGLYRQFVRASNA